MNRFPPGTKIIVAVIFFGEFRIGWEYDNKRFVPGMGSYYNFNTAVDVAWKTFMKEFPDHISVKTCRHLIDDFDYACSFCNKVVSATSNGYYPDGEPVGEE
jgi:hypothetical protein